MPSLPNTVIVATGRWNSMSFVEQMSNIGSEIGRTISWKGKGRFDFSHRAFEPALEVLDLTIADPRNRRRLRELLRLREALDDYIFFDNDYQSDNAAWERFKFLLLAAGGNR